MILIHITIWINFRGLCWQGKKRFKRGHTYNMITFMYHACSDKINRTSQWSSRAFKDHGAKAGGRYISLEKDIRWATCDVILYPDCIRPVRWLGYYIMAFHMFPLKMPLHHGISNVGETSKVYIGSLYVISYNCGFPGDLVVKNTSANTSSIFVLGRSLEEEIAAHSSILTWNIPWTEKPGGLQSMCLHSQMHWASTHTQSTVISKSKV